MKKNFLLAMVVMLMTAVSSFAQKEYNMVITLSNGTTVTLGHNDIKEITFNDGEVAISGNMVNTIDSLAKVSQEQEYHINDQEYHIKAVEKMSEAMFNDLSNRTEALNQRVDANMAETKARITATETNFDNKTTSIQTTLQNVYELVKQQSEEIKVLDTKIAILEALITKYHPETAESK